jgi:hypothetical protein
MQRLTLTFAEVSLVGEYLSLIFIWLLLALEKIMEAQRVGFDFWGVYCR